MDASPPESLAKREVVTDLRAAVEARRELGGELEEHVLEAFLARVQQRIDAQVAEQLARSSAKPPTRHRKGHVAGWVLPASLAASIPLVAAAGFYARGFGILVVMVAVVALVSIYFENSKR